MSTCKDCLHYEACKGTYFTFKQMIDKDSFEHEHYADIYNCSDFTNRSEWVHLPCKVGDKVFRLYYEPRHNGEINPNSNVCENCYDECDIKRAIMEYTAPSIGFIVRQFIEDEGTFYLTREEAEKALEEKKNGNG